MRQLDGTVHRVVIDLVRARLDHHDLLAGGDDGHVKVGDLALLARGVEDQLAIDETDLQRADRAVPGNVGDGSGGCFTDCSCKRNS